MSPELDAFEFDQFQRYAALRKVLHVTYPARLPDHPIRILDVGSGPERLTEMFLGSGFEVRRSDVSGFGQDDILVLTPGGPLPAADISYDVVVLLEVLEHVPRDARRSLVAECARVARELVVASVPNGSPEVVAAEKRVSDVFESINGEPHPFLKEHEQFGLPDEAELAAIFAAERLAIVTIPNAQLVAWEAFVTFDQLLRTVDGGPGLALELYRAANQNEPVRANHPFYRQLVFAAKDPAVIERVRAAVASIPEVDPTDRTTPLHLLARTAAVLLSKARATELDLERALAATQQAVADARAAKAADSDLRESLERALERERSTHRAELAAAHAREAALHAANQRAAESLAKAQVDVETARADAKTAAADALAAAEGLRESAERARSEAETAASGALAAAAGLRESNERSARLLTRQFFSASARRATLRRRVQDAASSRNVPFGAEPTSGVTNVLSEGHSLWAFSTPDDVVRFSCTLVPGRYLFRGRIAGADTAALVVRIGGGESTYLATAQRRAADFSTDVEVSTDAERFTLTVDRAVPFVLLGDFHVLAVDRNVTKRVVGILLEKARRFRAARWIARTRPGQALKRRLYAELTPQHERSANERWISKRIELRRSRYPVRGTTGLLSFVTTVWNTRADYLTDLARTLLGQDYRQFEWVVLDNGSSESATRAALATIAADRRVRVLRVEANAGIVGGMRICLESANGKYIVPVDSDDLLSPDAARVIAWHIERFGNPSILYSDEDRVWDGALQTAYLKPEWDPVLFANSCYVAHVCAIDRELALRLGAYTDVGAEGSHDWDTFVRFSAAGYRPVHIPEVLYSWRMHDKSAALNMQSKPYIYDSQKHVIEKIAAAPAQPQRFSVQLSPLFEGTPDWWIRRRECDARGILSLVLVAETGSPAFAPPKGFRPHRTKAVDLSAEAAALRVHALEALGNGELIHFVYGGVRLASDAWPWDAIGLIERYPDIVMVGGRVVDSQDRIVAAGEYLGFGGDCSSPDVGRVRTDPGYFAQMWKQRSVSAVPTMFAFAEPAFLVKLLDDKRSAGSSIRFLGAWAAAAALRTGRRIAYSPYLLGKLDGPATAWNAALTHQERAEFVRANRDILPDARYLSPLLSLDPAAPYVPSSEDQRTRFLRAQWAETGTHEDAVALEIP